MSIAISFLLGGLTYCLLVALCYTPSFRESNLYFPVGALLGVFTNVLWLHVAKLVGDRNKIIIYGLWWDCLIIACYAIVPILFFGVRLTGYTALGAALIVVGMILTKLG